MKRYNDGKMKSGSALNIIYLYCFVVFFMAQFLTIGVGNVQLSMSRGILILLLILIIIGGCIENKRVCVSLNYSFVFLVIWFVWQFVNVVWGRRYGIGGWLDLTYLIAIYLLNTMIFFTFIKDISLVKKVLFSFQMGIAVQAAIGLYEHITGRYHFTSLEFYNTGPWYQKVRWPVAMQTNPNDFALLMFFGFFISLACGKLYQKKLWRFFSFILSGLCVYLIIIADARAVMIGLLISSLVYCVIEFKKTRKRMILVLALLLVVALFGGIFGAPLLVKFIQEKLYFSSSGTSESTRWEIIQTGVQYFIESFGLGIGNHGVVAWHNFWVELLVECGFLIFVAYATFYVKLYNRMKYIKQDVDNDEKIIAKMIRCIMVGFVVACMGPASILNIEWIGVIFSLFITFDLIRDKNKILC